MLIHYTLNPDTVYNLPISSTIHLTLEFLGRKYSECFNKFHISPKATFVSHSPSKMYVLYINTALHSFVNSPSYEMIFILGA